MKNVVFLLFILVVVVLQGCIVKSLHPFYSQKDLVIHGSFRQDTDPDWSNLPCRLPVAVASAKIALIYRRS